MARLSDQELAALLEAASGTVHSPVKEYPEGNDWASLEGSRRQWRMRESKEKLRDLAPALAQEVLGRREAGQAVYEALAWVLPWLLEVPLPVNDQTLRDRFADELQQAEAALARWAKLTETEVRDDRS